MQGLPLQDRGSAAFAGIQLEESGRALDAAYGSLTVADATALSYVRRRTDDENRPQDDVIRNHDCPES